MSSEARGRHTPGSWEATSWITHAPTTVMATLGDHKVVVAECSGHGRNTLESVDDARLMASAPDLLKALKNMLNLYLAGASDPQAQPGQYAKEAEAAIAKAEGAMGIYMGNKPLTVREAADAMNLSQSCIRAWVARRKIGVIRLGRAIRIPATEVNRLLTENAIPARVAR